MRVRVKICGITRPEDAALAARLGADAIGLVFYSRSPRAIDPEAARAVVEVLPPFVTRVGLFVDADRAEVERVLDRVPLDLLQFHGDESPEGCASFGRSWIKAIRMRDDLDVTSLEAIWAGAQGLLLDAWVPGVAGGTGQTFDWSRVPSRSSLPILLAGGLSADNVGVAIARVRPWAVDVSGGVEAAKGIKDPTRMARFFAAVAEANRLLENS